MKNDIESVIYDFYYDILQQLQVSDKEISVHQIEDWLNESVMPIYKDLAINYFSQIQGEVPTNNRMKNFLISLSYLFVNF